MAYECQFESQVTYCIASGIEIEQPVETDGFLGAEEGTDGELKEAAVKAYADVCKAMEGREYIRLKEDEGTKPNVFYLI